MSAFHLTVPAVVLLQVSLAVNAQGILQDYDSLPLMKPEMIRPTYVFPSPGIGTAKLDHNKPFSTQLPPTKKKFEGLFTLATGISSGTSFWSNYLGTHVINLTDPQESWRVHIYCNGSSDTDRKRVKNDDGSFSLTKAKSIRLDWFGGGQGFLMEQSDTVGVFLLIIDPESDQQLAPWLKSLEQQYEIPAIAKGPMSSLPPSWDYAVYGKIRDKFFYIIVSGRRWVSLILLDDKPAGVFQSDFNHLLITTKKWRLAPYVLIDKSLDEPTREDVMKLAMVSWITTRTIGISKY